LGRAKAVSPEDRPCTQGSKLSKAIAFEYAPVIFIAQFQPGLDIAKMTLQQPALEKIVTFARRILLLD
jgi:hypothetical protein